MTDMAQQLLNRWRSPSLRQQVIQAALTGTELVASQQRPTEPESSNQIDGELIYEALSGKYGPLHHRGLLLTGLYVKGDLDLSRLAWTGELALQQCHIEGDIDLAGARPVGDVNLEGSWLQTLNIRSAVIDGNLIMRGGFHAKRGIYGIGATITAAFNLRDGSVSAPEEKAGTMAIEIFRAKIGDMFLQNSMVDGGMYAVGMTVARHVRLYGATFRSRASMGWQYADNLFDGALALASTNIKGTLYLSSPSIESFSADGECNLRMVSCTQLSISKDILTRYEFALEGMTYTRLMNIQPNDFLEALGTVRPFSPRSYVQLATYCTSVGDLPCRRRALIELEKRLTRELPRMSPTRWSRAAYGLLVGYGYSAWLAIIWLALVTVLATVILHYGGAIFAPKPPAGTLPGGAVNLGWSSSLRVVIDSFLPFASLGMKDSWVAAPSDWGQWAWMFIFLLLRFLAWGLAALALLSFTGVVRNPRA
ncbi:hypothetical protein [Nocardia anaemiae]|uniref:hypothetical protein n=1 Tax=Nocardia anaemiae TaxID=263910 RepID=UPI0012F4CF89|nr:hypothetical protein [Nocardia anaemiae]